MPFCKNKSTKPTIAKANAAVEKSAGESSRVRTSIHSKLPPAVNTVIRADQRVLRPNGLVSSIGRVGCAIQFVNTYALKVSKGNSVWKAIFLEKLLWNRRSHILRRGMNKANISMGRSRTYWSKPAITEGL